MKIGIVKTLAIQGSRKKIFRNGDKVTENNFTSERWAELVKGGYITEGEPSEEPAVPLEEKEVKVTDSADLGKTDAGKSEEDLDSKSEEGSEEGKSGAPKDETGGSDETDLTEQDEITRKEIMVELDKLGVEYGKNMSKAELYELFRAAKENK